MSPRRTDGTGGFIRRLKKAHAQNWALIFTDEASFRQDSTLHATWSRMGHPPEVLVTGERKNVKILGAIELWRTRFHYREDNVFNADSYLAFLEQLARCYHCDLQGALRDVSMKFLWESYSAGDCGFRRRWISNSWRYWT
jgi:hypothetical protein